MDWTQEVSDKLKRKNQVLFSKESAVLWELSLLLEEQTHRVLVLWAFSLAEGTVRQLSQKYPEELRPQQALETARLWAEGKVKMPVAQRAILNCHAVAKELSSPEDIALCHAVGQACSVVHTGGHALGFPFYELTAIVRVCGKDAYKAPVEKRVQDYVDALLYWREQEPSFAGNWAGFMLK